MNRACGALSFAILAATGCGGGTGVTISGAELNDPTLEAVDAASDVVQSLAQATVLAQLPIAPLSGSPGSFPPGTCPLVQGSPGLLLTPMEITIGFDGSCPAAADFVCSGGAAGQLDLASSRLALTFNSVICGQRILTGSVDLGFTPLPSGADLNGNWNLTSALAQEQTFVLGAGESIYDRNLAIANLITFTGQVTEPLQQYTVTLDAVQISIINNGALVPDSGTVTMTGGAGSTTIITFGSDSPVTGNVQVTTADGAVQTVNLFTLPQPDESTP